VRLTHGVLFFLSLVGLLVYFIIFRGLFSVRKYRLLGSMRRGGQRVSFELAFFFLGFSYMCIVLGFEFHKAQIGIIHIFLVPYFLVIAIVELGRAPFDFPERESE